ncbi:hypothetical protein ACTWP5_31960 [Streptomyces sp. 4N509B]|uniref:hypothetical protein n=1 Tax=Streptomyces sp. 4N509B TaxID=3457413 RepID=UPI003FD2CE98
MAATTGEDPLHTTRFRAACHEAARRTPGVTFYELTEAAVTPAFHSAAMSDRVRRHRILCHPHTGFVAFASPPPFPGSGELRFHEPPRWAEVFDLHGLRVLRPEVLATPLTRVRPRELDDDARARLRRDRARTLGEWLFG